jgi:hypothetical protein
LIPFDCPKKDSRRWLTPPNEVNPLPIVMISGVSDGISTSCYRSQNSRTN